MRQLVGVSLTAPPLQSCLAPRILLQQHFKGFIFPLKTVSLQTHHLFGNIFRQERNTILLNASRDRLIGLDTLNCDTVFLFKEVQMLLSGGVFKPVSIQKYLTLPSSSTLWIRSRTMSLSEPPLILHTGEYDRIRIRCALHILV